MNDTQTNPEPITIIEPKKNLVLPDIKKLFQYKELLYFLTKRDIKTC